MRRISILIAVLVGVGLSYAGIASGEEIKKYQEYVVMNDSHTIDMEFVVVNNTVYTSLTGLLLAYGYLSHRENEDIITEQDNGLTHIIHLSNNTVEKIIGDQHIIYRLPIDIIKIEDRPFVPFELFVKLFNASYNLGQGDQIYLYSPRISTLEALELTFTENQSLYFTDVDFSSSTVKQKQNIDNVITNFDGFFDLNVYNTPLDQQEFFGTYLLSSLVTPSEYEMRNTFLESSFFASNLTLILNKSGLILNPALNKAQNIVAQNLKDKIDLLHKGFIRNVSARDEEYLLKLRKRLNAVWSVPSTSGFQIAQVAGKATLVLDLLTGYAGYAGASELALDSVYAFLEDNRNKKNFPLLHALAHMEEHIEAYNNPLFYAGMDVIGKNLGEMGIKHMVLSLAGRSNVALVTVDAVLASWKILKMIPAFSDSLDSKKDFVVSFYASCLGPYARDGLLKHRSASLGGNYQQYLQHRQSYLKAGYAFLKICYIARQGFLGDEGAISTAAIAEQEKRQKRTIELLCALRDDNWGFLPEELSDYFQGCDDTYFINFLNRHPKTTSMDEIFTLAIHGSSEAMKTFLEDKQKGADSFFDMALYFAATLNHDPGVTGALVKYEANPSSFAFDPKNFRHAAHISRYELDHIIEEDERINAEEGWEGDCSSSLDGFMMEALPENLDILLALRPQMCTWHYNCGQPIWDAFENPAKLDVIRKRCFLMNIPSQRP